VGKIGSLVAAIITRPGDLKSPESCHELATGLLEKTLCAWGELLGKLLGACKLDLGKLLGKLLGSL
jgi:hypothetical protein